MQIALLDTDILNEVLKKRNLQVVRKAAAYLQQHQKFAISGITWYEIVRGLREKRAVRQLANFDRFCQCSTVIDVTPAILDRSADLWVHARRGGHPDNDADLIIAATAMEQSRALVTGNTDHFSWIPGLVLENWREP
jgi:tRNA(fMet)-specific endonuclease VapC